MKRCANFGPYAARVCLLLVAVASASFSPIASAQDAAPPVAAPIAPAPKFIGRFSNGVEVELIGVSASPSNANSWHGPDGAPLAAPYQPPAGRGNPWNSPMLREVCWRWRGVEEPEMQTGWGFEATNTNGQGWIQPIGPDGNVIKDLTAYVVPFTLIQPSTTVRFTLRYPGSQWQTFWQGQGGGGMAYSRRDGSGFTIDKTRAIDGGAFVVMGYKLPMNLDVRLSAIDGRGQRHVGKCEMAGSLNEFRLLAATFPDLAPENIRTWIVEQRLRVTETIAFHNVSLEPGAATFVQVEGPIADGVPVAAGADDSAELEFGRIVEALLHSDFRMRDGLVDFDAERAFPIESGVSEDQSVAWLKDHGVDVVAMLESDSPSLMGFDLIAVSVKADVWNTPDKLAGQLRGAQPMTPATLDASGELPATFVFQTGEGARGVLQIVEFVPGASVKIRYKLARAKDDD